MPTCLRNMLALRVSAELESHVDEFGPLRAGGD
jgi:hypothetical protein